MDHREGTVSVIEDRARVIENIRSRFAEMIKKDLFKEEEFILLKKFIVYQKRIIDHSQRAINFLSDGGSDASELKKLKIFVEKNNLWLWSGQILDFAQKLKLEDDENFKEIIEFQKKVLKYSEEYTPLEELEGHEKSLELSRETEIFLKKYLEKRKAIYEGKYGKVLDAILSFQDEAWELGEKTLVTFGKFKKLRDLEGSEGEEGELEVVEEGSGGAGAGGVEEEFNLLKKFIIYQKRIIDHSQRAIDLLAVEGSDASELEELKIFVQEDNLWSWSRRILNFAKNLKGDENFKKIRRFQKKVLKYSEKYTSLEGLDIDEKIHINDLSKKTKIFLEKYQIGKFKKLMDLEGSEGEEEFLFFPDGGGSPFEKGVAIDAESGTINLYQSFESILSLPKVLSDIGEDDSFFMHLNGLFSEIASNKKERDEGIASREKILIEMQKVVAAATKIQDAFRRFTARRFTAKKSYDITEAAARMRGAEKVHKPKMEPVVFFQQLKDRSNSTPRPSLTPRSSSTIRLEYTDLSTINEGETVRIKHMPGVDPVDVISKAIFSINKPKEIAEVKEQALLFYTALTVLITCGDRQKSRGRLARFDKDFIYMGFKHGVDHESHNPDDLIVAGNIDELIDKMFDVVEKGGGRGGFLQKEIGDVLRKYCGKNKEGAIDKEKFRKFCGVIGYVKDFDYNIIQQLKQHNSVDILFGCLSFNNILFNKIKDVVSNGNRSEFYQEFLGRSSDGRRSSSVGRFRVGLSHASEGSRDIGSVAVSDGAGAGSVGGAGAGIVGRTGSVGGAGAGAGSSHLPSAQQTTPGGSPALNSTAAAPGLTLVTRRPVVSGFGSQIPLPRGPVVSGFGSQIPLPRGPVSGFGGQVLGGASGVGRK